MGETDAKVLVASAPGRICLFGEHQDYLGLPVIAAAIDLTISLRASRRSQPGFLMSLPDVGQAVEIDPNVLQIYVERRDYLRSCVNVLRRLGVTWPTGYDIEVHGSIPINAGVSSSSAMVVMWLRFLLSAGSPLLTFTPEALARWAYESEVVEFGEPGGMMDHYCSALGGILQIDTRPPFICHRFDVALSGFVLGHSLEPKATLETLGRVRQDVAEGVAEMKQLLPGFSLADTPVEVADLFLGVIHPVHARRVRANLVNRDLTIAADPALSEGDSIRVGRLLSAHHEQLRDGLDLSTPKIERMIEAADAAGALGAKINGSGGGGCMFAYAPGREDAVAEAIRRAGGKAWIVRVATV